MHAVLRNREHQFDLTRPTQTCGEPEPGRRCTNEERRSLLTKAIRELPETRSPFATLLAMQPLLHASSLAHSWSFCANHFVYWGSSNHLGDGWVYPKN